MTLARLLGRVADYLRKKADYEKSLQWYKAEIRAVNPITFIEETE